MSFSGVSDLIFDEDGFFGHTRAIERLALMLSDIGFHGGDGNQSGDPFNDYATSPGSGQGGTFSAIINRHVINNIHYLGTLDVPVFAGYNLVAGDAAGLYAVDWQQQRTASTQVASGSYSTILGGLGNTASGQYAIAGGDACVASSIGTVALGVLSTASNLGSVAIGFGANATGQEAFALSGSEASGARSFAFGYRSKAAGNSSVAIGNTARVTGDYSIHLGTASAATDTVTGSNSLLVSTLDSTTPSVTGSHSCVLLPGQGNAFAANGSFSFGQYGFVNPTFDNSLIVTLKSPVASSTQVRESVIFQIPTFNLQGTGTVTNYYSLGLPASSQVQSSITSTDSYSNIFSFSGYFYTTAAGLAVNSDLFAVKSDVLSSNSTFSDSSFFNSVCTNDGASASSRIFTAVAKVNNHGWKTAGHNDVCILGGYSGGGAPLTVTADKQVWIGYGGYPGYSPATLSTTVMGELGATGKFGCNAAQPQAPASVNAAVAAAGVGYSQAYANSQTNLLNQIRAALVANGICT